MGHAEGGQLGLRPAVVLKLTSTLGWTCMLGLFHPDTWDPDFLSPSSWRTHTSLLHYSDGLEMPNTPRGRSWDRGLLGPLGGL